MTACMTWTPVELLLWVASAAVAAFHLGRAGARRWEHRVPSMPWAEEQCEACGQGVQVAAPTDVEALDLAMDWLGSHEQQCHGRW